MKDQIILIDIDELNIKKEYEDLQPKMSPLEEEALLKSMKANGQLEAIKVDAKTKEIYDGHHRYKARKLLGYKTIKAILVTVDDPIGYIKALNEHRRHLTKFQLIEQALKEKPALLEQAKLNESLGGKGVQICTPLGRVNEVIAKRVWGGASATQVHQVEVILRQGSEELIKRCRNGRTKIDKAYNPIKTMEERDQLILQAKQVNKYNSNSKLTPYELYLGKFQDVLPNMLRDNSIPMIFTDPSWKKEDLPQYNDLAIYGERGLQDGASLIATVGMFEYLDTIKGYFRDNAPSLTYWHQLTVILTGHKTARSFPKAKGIIFDVRPMIWYVKGKKRATPYMVHDSVESAPPDKVKHEWAQGLKEAIYYIGLLTFEGQTVLDPFCGSGTTAIAALRLGRRFIGCEKDAERFQIAEANIKLNLQPQIANLTIN